MKIWAWGANTNGQLGLGFISEQVSSPTAVVNTAEQLLVPGDTKPISIQGGASRTLILAENLPKNVDISGNFHIFRYPKFAQISCGWDFNLFLDSNSQIYSSGDNSYGQLGRVTVNPVSGVTVKVSNEWKPAGDPESGVKLRQISAGMRHAAGISFDDGSIYVWGDNSKNQLGLVNSALKIIEVPTRVTHQHPENGGFNFVRVRCGKSFTLALDDNGFFFGCGINKFGQLCHAPQDFGNFIRFVPILERIPNAVFNHQVKDFQCGWSHVLVLLENGKVLSWGRNNFGQLGRISANPEFDVEPHFVDISEPVSAIACGTEHNLALGISGKVYSWGWNEHDNCGVPTKCHSEQEIKSSCILLPTEVIFPEKLKVAVIGCGAGNSFAVSN